MPVQALISSHRPLRPLHSPAVPPSGTQELFTDFGAEPKLELSSFRGRTVSRASHDSNRSLGRFRFGDTQEKDAETPSSVLSAQFFPRPALQETAVHVLFHL
jgi:hypothetical protein